MKITILKEKLKEGLNIVERISQKSLSLPILNNILIKTEKNFLSLTTTNLEIGIKWWALSKIDQEGEIVVPSKLLSQFVNYLPDGPLELETDGLSLYVKNGKYKSLIKGFSAEEFPLLPRVDQGEKIILDSQVFCQGIEQVFEFTSPSVSRPEISGVFFQFQKEQIKIVATDSFRLTEKKIFLQTPIIKKYSFILPQLTTREIVNILSGRKEELIIYFSPNQVLFEVQFSEIDHPQIHLISRLIEGEFPDYEDIIPKKFETKIILSKEEFLKQIKLASLFSGRINEIKLKISPKTEEVEVFSQNPDFGQYQSTLQGKIEGKTLSISFNHRFLIDGLLKIKTPQLLFEFTNEEGPALLRPVDSEDYLYVIMPIKAS